MSYTILLIISIIIDVKIKVCIIAMQSVPEIQDGGWNVQIKAKKAIS